MIIEVLKIVRASMIVGIVIVLVIVNNEIGRINKRNRQRMIFWECPTKHCYLAKSKVSKITHL